MEHPGRFTTVCVFLRCEAYGAWNIIKDACFACDVCGAQLPERWNLG